MHGDPGKGGKGGKGDGKEGGGRKRNRKRSITRRNVKMLSQVALFSKISIHNPEYHKEGQCLPGIS